MDPFLLFFNTLIKVDDATIKLVEDHCRVVTIPRKKIVLHEGDLANRVYFVVSGKARSFYTDFSGKTTTWLFHFNVPESHIKNLFLVDYKGFVSNQPSQISIETLTEVRAILFTREQTDFLIEHSAIFERGMRRISDASFTRVYDRIYTLLTMSADQRYKKLLKEEPHLLQLFSNNDIASYLGVAPQSLSRIKAIHAHGKHH